MPLLKLVVAFLIAGIALTAHADWQWTKWGMTPAEVIAASKGDARTASAEETKKLSDTIAPAKDALVVAVYEAAGMKFQSVFQFHPSTAKLMCVDLIPSENIAYDDMESRLTNVYGVPSRKTNEDIASGLGIFVRQTTWLATDRIELRQTTIKNTYGKTRTRYCSRKSDDEKGL